jgi:hypothetical protein
VVIWYIFPRFGTLHQGKNLATLSLTSRLVDFSDPSLRPSAPLPEDVTEFLSKTSMFEDFVVAFTDQCLTLIQNTSREQVGCRTKNRLFHFTL